MQIATDSLVGVAYCWLQTNQTVSTRSLGCTNLSTEIVGSPSGETQIAVRDRHVGKVTNLWNW